MIFKFIAKAREMDSAYLRIVDPELVQTQVARLHNAWSERTHEI